MAEVVIRNNNVTVQVTQPGTTETVMVLQGPPGHPGADGAPGVPGANGVVQSIVAGTNVTVNSADPAHPVVSATGGGGTAATTTFTPAGNVAATNVQAAIQELDTEKSGTGHTHAASAITFTPTGTVAASTVQAAIAEVDSEKETPAGAQSKVNAHAAATDPHGDRAYADGKFSLLGHTHTSIPSLGVDSRTVANDWSYFPAGLSTMPCYSGSGPWPGSGAGVVTTLVSSSGSPVGNDGTTSQSLIDQTNPPRFFVRRWIVATQLWSAWSEK